MKARFGLQVAGVVLGAMVSAMSLAAVDLYELENECLDMDGEYLVDSCVITTVVETPYSQMVKPSGKSGLGWTAIGVTVETTVDTYSVDVTSEEVEVTGEIQVFVAGDMSEPGCKKSSGQPQKCFDHYKTKTVTEMLTVYSYSWLEESSVTTTKVVVTGCLNPGRHNMGMHKQCAI